MGLVRLPSEAEQGQFPNSVDSFFGCSVVPMLLVGDGVSGPNDLTSDLLAIGRLVHIATL